MTLEKRKQINPEKTGKNKTIKMIWEINEIKNKKIEKFHLKIPFNNN